MSGLGTEVGTDNAEQVDMAEPCRHCGGDIDLSPERIAAIVAETPIDPSLAADDGLYQKRLAVCAQCEALREEVMCAYCGCFILFRARPQKSYCPHPKGDLWDDMKILL